MMAQTGGFVLFACFALLGAACGSTTRNDANSDTSGAGSETGSVGGNTTGSGGSSTDGVTAVGSTGSSTGTGGTTANTCPSFEPASGTTCTDQGQVCFYENCQAPDYNDGRELTCTDGAWHVSGVTPCPTSQCPVIPSPGTYCDASVTPGPCLYFDACGAEEPVECIRGIWQTDNGDEKAAPGEDPVVPVPTCPTHPPFLGYPCCPTAVPEICDYTESASDGAAGASFIIIPPTSTSGGGADEAPPSLTCAVCTADKTWNPCPER